MNETPPADEPGFGELLLRLRRASGLTQADLAEASGVSVRALSDLERGRARAAQRRSTEALADALGLTGPERSRFLELARQGRQRGARPVPLPPAVAPLPSAVPDLVGRTAELERLRAAALDAARTPGGVVVSVVGHPGVGKTALAATAAYALREEFPDGCFSVDLRGMDDQPVAPRAALDLLLRALGVPAEQIPVTVEEQTALFRSLLSGRRTMILLDNAADETQLRPLLARTTGCLTVITCRRALVGLESGRWIWLTALSQDDAASLVGTIIGHERTRAEPEAVAELAELCGNLPLAVRIAGNRLASRPHWTIEHLVTLLRDERTRLAALSAGDLRVRSAFAMSHRRLTGEARLVFQRLALIPGPAFGVELAAIATGLPEPRVRLYIDELVDANLLQAGAQDGRYSYHDLIRLFARERLEAEEDPDDLAKVRTAVVSYLLDTAMVAASLLHPEATKGNPRFPAREDAVRWLDGEAANWLAAQRLAARDGDHRRVVGLAEAMHWYSDVRQQHHPWDQVFELGLTAARALGDRHAEAKLLNFVGWARYLLMDDHEGGYAAHREALALAREIGDSVEETWAQGYLGAVLMRLGRPEEALEHSRVAAVARGLGFWAGQAPLRNVLGQVLTAAGRPEEALAVHRAVLADGELQRSEANPETYRFLRSLTFRFMGNAHVKLGEWAEAARAYRTERALFDEAQAPMDAAEAGLREGRAWREAGEYEPAVRCLRAALTAFTEPFSRWSRAQTLAELASVLELAGDAEASREYREEAAVLCGQVGTEAAERLAAELARA
ncbi:helix-turn-helix domain-containing protein [Amycolatopsis sacchari]|uniref:helix-turn-helix domain-containing protein n=1 Tax=Amycolatopsis sacchari TaxID=115433 RepID=UPI003D75927C